MNIKLYKLKIADHMSEETTAFTAEIFINGRCAGYAKNDGRGGSTDYHRNPDPKSKELMELAEKHCLSLPPIKYPASHGMKEFEVEMNLENFIDQLVQDELIKKEQKKLEKKFVNCIVWGVPNGGIYTQAKFKVPLNIIPKDKLQPIVDKYKLGLKDGEKILNTNLEALGIII